MKRRTVLFMVWSKSWHWHWYNEWTETTNKLYNNQSETWKKWIENVFGYNEKIHCTVSQLQLCDCPINSAEPNTAAADKDKNRYNVS